MTKIGVIGCGAIGRDHIRRITEVLTHAEVTACSDVFVEGGRKTADQYGLNFYEKGADLIAAPEVDAVVVCSNDASHAEFVLASIAAEKQVFCEKPLGTSAEECMGIVKAEVQAGRRLVQVGFMRRYDRGYIEMKKALQSGRLGAPLMIHACHRNKSHVPSHTSDMTVKNAGIHEIDVLRWLLEEDYESGQVLTVRQNANAAAGLLDPQIILLQTKSGARIDVEVNMSDGYGYDIQCEVVCEKGTLRLPDPNTIHVRENGRHSCEIFEDWSLRFVEAYDQEFIQWVDSIRQGAPTGPSAWDGYCACVTADTLISTRGTGTFRNIELPAIPELYLR